MPESFTVREAISADYTAISDLIAYEYYVHRHLDWRQPIDWLGCPPYFVLQGREKRLYAALACPPDPPEIAWLRLFACSALIEIDQAWMTLLEAARSSLPDNPHPAIAILSLQSWLNDLALATGFSREMEIIVLEWLGHLPPAIPTSQGMLIRPMIEADLPIVEKVDRTAFAPLWQNTLSTLTRSLAQAAYATVAELNGEIVGYQVSTAGIYSAHLARLAVYPHFQRQHIGYALVRDLQTHFKTSGIWNITVNTQSNNPASLALYQKLGYHRTGDTFPVFVDPGT
jgi:ribosomal protein S18 acetylase RimI-like enzyme